MFIFIVYSVRMSVFMREKYESCWIYLLATRKYSSQRLYVIVVLYQHVGETFNDEFLGNGTLRSIIKSNVPPFKYFIA